MTDYIMSDKDFGAEFHVYNTIRPYSAIVTKSLND